MKRAVVLAGGKGTRLRPYTIAFPKPLMPIGEYPILEVVIRQLRRHGFDHVTLAVNHQAELLRAFCGDGSKWDLRIDYSLESMPLGTMGPLKLIRDLPENFLVMNGDVLSDLDFGAFFDAHVQAGRHFTISAARRAQSIDYGVLHVEGEALVGFEEKPVVPYLVSMGVYAMSRRAADAIPQDTAFGFDQLMLDFLRRGEPVHVEPFDGYWLDIGRPDDYQRAVDDWPELSRTLLP